mgnify:CR=1 FL=1
MKGYKILTHDWRSPIQGGSPLCTEDQLPLTLPVTVCDQSHNDCGKGWNFCPTLVQAARIAGFWRTGRPARCLVVEATGEIVIRGNKCRTTQLQLQRVATHDEIRQAMQENIQTWAGRQTDLLVEEQWQWYVALGRPYRDEATVQAGLRTALDTRKLDAWTLQQFSTLADLERTAWAAWAARDAWAAREAREAWDARDAWAAREAWDVQDAWDAWDARDAQIALLMFSSVSCHWLDTYESDHLTRGIRSAYMYGLEKIRPIQFGVLGWCMEPTV